MNRAISLCVLAVAIACQILQTAAAGETSTKPPYVVPQQYSAEYVNHHLQHMYIACYSDVNKRRAEWGNKNKTDSVAWVRNGSTCYQIFGPEKPGKPGHYSVSMGSFHSTPLNMVFPSGTWEKIGTERVQGIMADKYRLTHIKNQNPAIVSIYWINPKTRVPVRFTVAPDSPYRLNVFECTRFEIGPQPDSLFRPPAGYFRM